MDAKNKLMTVSEYKKYTEILARGSKGEAFFESLIVDYAIPHRIARQNDLGVDFLCEWIHGDRPTGILFSHRSRPRQRNSFNRRSSANQN